MEIRRVETSAEVYAVIFARHRDQLQAFASYTEMDAARMGTQWSIVGSSIPFIEFNSSWEWEPSADGNRTNRRRINEKSMFYIHVPIEE